MFKLKKSNLLHLGVFSILGYFLWVSFTQPGVGDLKSDFKEVAVYRNENNTGPITRIYAVVVGDTLWEEMQKYGDFMLHTKYGNTKVYFFSNQAPSPSQLNPGEENFEEKYKDYCLAKYEKNNIGTVSFIKFPYNED